MKTPQDKNDELKERLAGALEYMQTLFNEAHKRIVELERHPSEECLLNQKKVIQGLRKRCDEFMAENKLYREDLAKHEAEIERLNKDNARLNGDKWEYVANFEAARDSLAKELSELKQQPKLQWITDRRPTADDAFPVESRNHAAVVTFDEASKHPRFTTLENVKHGQGWLGRHQLGNPESINDLAGIAWREADGKYVTDSTTPEETFRAGWNARSAGGGWETIIS